MSSRRYSAVPITCVAIALLGMTTPLRSQDDRSVAGLAALVNGLTVTPRVLIIGAHPDDADTPLIAWLARGRSVETGYLSLTRGESGQNFIGPQLGVALGALRTEEALASRRIDGGDQFFTRAYDFGFAKTADDAFKRWPRDSLLGDIVTIIRSFRPHVLVDVSADGVTDGNGQHQAVALLAYEAYTAAGDTERFPTFTFGHAWAPLKFYRHGTGLVIDPHEFDALRGKTYAAIALESRAQTRSQGFADLIAPARSGPDFVQLRRVASRVNDNTLLAAERSIFDGIDTSFARLLAEAPSAAVVAIPLFAAMADSARSALDLRRTASVVPYLARAVRLADSVRAAVIPCLHPAIDAQITLASAVRCPSRALDLEAAIDLVRRRAAQALLLAAGVSVEAQSDRELIADGDSVPIAITVFNRGDGSITLNDVNVSGAPTEAMQSVVIPADSAARVYRTVTGLAESHPWWIGTRVANLFPRVASAADGRARLVLASALIRRGVSIPEQIRRTSDVTVTLTLAGATVTTSVGPITYRSADPRFGVQNRTVAGVSAATLTFERGLEWVRARTPMNRPLRLTIQSFSDRVQTFALEPLMPDALRLDSLPRSITLVPREQRELFLQLRGSLSAARYIFGMKGMSPSGTEFSSGFRPIQYAHVPPIRISRTSALYLQGVDVEIPKRLLVAHVRGVGDDIGASLTQIGIPTTTLDPDRLLMVDLSFFDTIVIGPRAFEARPDLAYQNARLLDFARKGGTVVVLQHTTIPSGLMPYPIDFAHPIPEHVTEPDAPVAVLDRKTRVLNWPNTITAKDWAGWVRERALFVPAVADAHYAAPIEVHDPGEKENRNSLLIASVGKGTYIYSALTFSQQLQGGVPGAMRLLVNLVSAGAARDEHP